MAAGGVAPGAATVLAPRPDPLEFVGRSRRLQGANRPRFQVPAARATPLGLGGLHPNRTQSSRACRAGHTEWAASCLLHKGKAELAALPPSFPRIPLRSLCR